jgi:hypothetical protein
MPLPIEIFRAGRHTAMSGETIAFSESDIAAVAGSYDPRLHEAPVVIGHPADNAPAYGWVASVACKGQSLEAQVDQIDPAFAELVRAGRFKKVSASFYKPDSPSNPKPGSWYLRHVGFLGAQPPAVKGLRDAAFAGAADECVTVELGEPDVATLFTQLRGWMIEKFGQDEADKVLPEAMIAPTDGKPPAAAAGSATSSADANAAAANPPPANGKKAGAVSMSEMDLVAALRALRDWMIGKFGQDEADKALPPDMLNWAQIDAAVGAVATPVPSYAEAPEHKARAEELAKREAAIVARERELRRSEHLAFLERLVRDGRPLPCSREHVVGLLELLEGADPKAVSFGEGEQRSPAQIFRDELLARLPKQVTFEELAGGAPAVDQDAEAIAARAIAFQEEQRAKGLVISTTEAVRHVKGGK